MFTVLQLFPDCNLAFAREAFCSQTLVSLNELILNEMFLAINLDFFFVALLQKWCSYLFVSSVNFFRYEWNVRFKKLASHCMKHIFNGTSVKFLEIWTRLNDQYLIYRAEISPHQTLLSVFCIIRILYYPYFVFLKWYSVTIKRCLFPCTHYSTVHMWSRRTYHSDDTHIL